MCLAGLMIMMFACGEIKREKAVLTDHSLAGTTWRYLVQDMAIDGSYYEYELTFGEDGKSTYAVTAYLGDGTKVDSISDAFLGTYTFDGSKGTVDYGQQIDPGTFSIEGGELKLIFHQETVSLTKADKQTE